MLEKLEQAKSSFGGRSQTIDKWLKERQSLLIKFCDLAGLNNAHSNTLPAANDVSDFCTMLMDYISAGHFEVYEMLVHNDPSGNQLKDELYPAITDTTDRALRFNDRYSEAISADQARDFDSQLAELGNVLEVRFALEDQLINHMHKVIKDQSAAASV